MNILFAPDYCTDNPYQRLLARALGECGSEVRFLSDYRRGLPLSRGCPSSTDLVHLHWPEAYFRASTGRLANWCRAIRYPIDLRTLTARKPLVLTAHNLLPHASSPRAEKNMAYTYRTARRIIAHSDSAADTVICKFRLDHRKVAVIPHGDLSVTLPPLVSQGEAQRRLSLHPGPLCLMFGGLAPYKGIEEAARHWPRTTRGTLAIVGDSFDKRYGDQLEAELGQRERVILHRKRVSDRELANWLSACDCTLFNYGRILTSGAASLARSLGVPILLPRRLATVDVGEPNARVFRFDSMADDFVETLERAFQARQSSPDTRKWRAETAWPRIAADTHTVYEQALTS